MVIDLSNVEFENDFFSTILPDGSILVLNKVDENLALDNLSAEIKAVNIEIQTDEDTVISCPCIIGMNNDYLSIDTAYTEYEGEVLTSDNMKYCTIQIYE